MMVMYMKRIIPIFLAALVSYVSIIEAAHYEKIIVLDQSVTAIFNKIGIVTPEPNTHDNQYVSYMEARELFDKARHVLARQNNILTSHEQEYLETYFNHVQDGSYAIDYETYKNCCKPKFFNTLCVKKTACVTNNVCAKNLAVCQLCSNEVDPVLVTAQNARITSLDTRYLTGTNAFITNLSGIQTINGQAITGLLVPGITGGDGITGITGNTGPQGAQGLTGLPGAQGLQGVAFVQEDYFCR
jgi:hypothetical protein